VSPPYIVAVVLAYNGEATLQATLEAIAAQTYPPRRVIVVDNASTDGSAGMAAASGADVIRLERNLGVGGGHNAGWERALEDPNAEMIWALEHDAVPHPTALRHEVTTLLGLRSGGHQVGAIIPAQTVGEPVPGTGGPSVTPLLHFNGCLLVTDALKAAGTCDDRFFCGHEDRELGLRMNAHGWLTVFDPTAVVHHANFGNASGARSTPFRRYYGWRNDIWVRVNVRHERWGRIRAVGAASLTLARWLRHREAGALAPIRAMATFDALTGRLGERRYRFLQVPGGDRP
jgi:GT2 family glycosyltransferase